MVRSGLYGQVAPAVGGVESVVLVTPDGQHGPATDTDAAADTLTIDQLGLRFSPTRLLVPQGATVRFVNSESLPHNVRLTRNGEDEPFLDRDTDPAAGFAHSFDAPGGVHVGCSIHPGMTAFIYVHREPIAAFATQDGHFELPDLGPGRYRVSAWSADASLRDSTVVELDAGATELVLGAHGGA